MAGVNDVSLTWTLQTKKVEQSLKKLEDVTAAEARKMAKEWRKAHEAIESKSKKTYKEMSRSAKRAGDQIESAMDRVGDVAGDADSAVKALAGAVGLVSPEAEKALSSLGDLAGGAEGATRAMDLVGLKVTDLASLAPPLTVAVAALGTALVVVANHTEDARMRLAAYAALIDDTTASTRTLAGAQRALKLATGDVEGFIGDLQISTAEMRGELDKSDLVAGRLGGTLADQLKPRLLDAGRAVAENEVRIQKLNAAIKSGSLNTEEMTDAVAQLAEARGLRPELAATLEEVKELQHQGRVAINAYAEALDNETAKTEQNTGAKSARVDTMREEAALLAQQEAATVQLHAIRDQLALDALEGEARLTEEYGRRIEKVNELAESSGDYAAAEEARRLLEIEHQAEVKELRDDLDAQREAEHQAEIARIEEERGRRIAALGQIADNTARIGQIAAQSFEEGSSAARTSFAVFQGITAAKTGVSAIAASVAALQPPPIGLGPVFGVPLAATTLALGAAESARIMSASPKYHRGVARFDPDEGAAILRRNEAVIPEAANRRNPGVAEAMIRGESVGGGGVYVLQIGHKAHRALLRRDARQPGSPIKQIARQDRRVGHGRYP